MILQWLTNKIDFLAVHEVKWGYFEKIRYLKSGAILFLKLTVIRYGLGLK